MSDRIPDSIKAEAAKLGLQAQAAGKAQPAEAAPVGGYTPTPRPVADGDLPKVREAFAQRGVQGPSAVAGERLGQIPTQPAVNAAAARMKAEPKAVETGAGARAWARPLPESQQPDHGKEQVNQQPTAAKTNTQQPAKSEPQSQAPSTPAPERGEASRQLARPQPTTEPAREAKAPEPPMEKG